MPQARKAAASKGAAARAEKAPQPKTLEWRGLTLTLPPQMPTMGVIAAWRRLEKASEARDGMAVKGYLVDMVDVILGGDERAGDSVWAVIDAGDDDEFDAVWELIEAAGGAYGVEPGESPASS